jgi:hypothetical protein
MRPDGQIVGNAAKVHRVACSTGSFINCERASNSRAASQGAYLRAQCLQFLLERRPLCAARLAFCLRSVDQLLQQSLDSVQCPAGVNGLELDPTEHGVQVLHHISHPLVSLEQTTVVNRLQLDRTEHQRLHVLYHVQHPLVSLLKAVQERVDLSPLLAVHA